MIMIDNINTQIKEEMPIIRVRNATKMLLIGDTSGITTYIYGVAGTGKTTLVRNFLAKRKYYELDAANLTEEQLLFQHALDKRKIVVIDNIHDLPIVNRENLAERIYELMARDDIWLILVGRCPIPPWLLEMRIRYDINIIDENKLIFNPALVEKYIEKTQMLLSDKQKEYMISRMGGYPFGWALSASIYKERVQEQPRILDKEEFIDYFREVEMSCYQYLEYRVYEQWEEDILKFLMELSIVGEFTAEMAEYITGRNNVSELLDRVVWKGNFLSTSVTKNNEKLYVMRSELKRSLNLRLHNKYKKERIRNIYINAGMFYRIKRQPLKALEMFEAVDARDRIIDLLEENSRLAPGKGYFYEMRKYYLDLKEDEILDNPYLMEGMSMLQSLLLNPDESERWYNELRDYGERQKGSNRKDIKSRLLYLDLALPCRGSLNFLDLMKNAYTLISKREVVMPEFTITSNLPSILNGGKDLTSWTKNEKELAVMLSKPVNAIFGMLGNSMVNLAIGESLLEKGEDSFEISSYIARGKMQAESIGNTEFIFVADGVLAWLHVLNGEARIAKEIMNNFLIKAIESGNDKIIMNTKTFLARIAMYEEDMKTVNDWLLDAPNEDNCFSVYDRFHYLTKIRAYMITGKYQMAYSLIMKLQYYAEVAGRTYIMMEVKLLQAMIMYRNNKDNWDELFSEVLDYACEYHFLKLITSEGAGVIKLLRETTWGNDSNNSERTFTKKEKAFIKELLKKTEEMGHSYPGYLKEGHEEITLCDNARRILKYLEQGAKQDVIMEELGLSKANVKYHTSQIYKKLNVNNRAEAVNEARKLGLL